MPVLKREKTAAEVIAAGLWCVDSMMGAGPRSALSLGAVVAEKVPQACIPGWQTTSTG